MLATAVLTGCAPEFDWREVRPADSGVSALFPCKPRTISRDLTLDGAPMRLTVAACEAGGATYALSYGSVADASRAGQALAALREAAVGNVHGIVREESPLRVSGMTPSPQALRLRLAASAPEGEGREVVSAFFSRGARIYQAAVVARQLDEASVESYVGSLVLSP